MAVATVLGITIGKGEEDDQAMRLAVRLTSLMAFSVGAIIIFYTMRYSVSTRGRELSLLLRRFSRAAKRSSHNARPYAQRTVVLGQPPSLNATAAGVYSPTASHTTCVSDRAESR